MRGPSPSAKKFAAFPPSAETARKAALRGSAWDTIEPGDGLLTETLMNVNGKKRTVWIPTVMVGVLCRARTWRQLVKNGLELGKGPLFQKAASAAHVKIIAFWQPMRGGFRLARSESGPRECPYLRAPTTDEPEGKSSTGTKSSWPEY